MARVGQRGQWVFNLLANRSTVALPNLIKNLLYHLVVAVYHLWLQATLVFQGATP